MTFNLYVDTQVVNTELKAIKKKKTRETTNKILNRQKKFRFKLDN